MKKLKIANKKRFFVSLISLFLALFLLLAYLGYDLYKPYLEKISQRIAQRQKQTVTLDSLGFKAPKDAEIFLYVNNKLQKKNSISSEDDNKIIVQKEDGARLFDLATGFLIDLPKKMTPDFSQSPSFVRMKSDFFDITISREYSPYEDVDEYISYYLNRFITNEAYRKPNNLELLADGTYVYGNNSARLISVKITDMPENKKNIYTYATIKTSGREFFRIMFKFRAESHKETENTVSKAIESFKRTKPFGSAAYDFSPKPSEADFWSKETKKLYRTMNERDNILWGIFAPDVASGGINHLIPEMEKALDFRFPIVLIYNHLGSPLPEGFGAKCAEQGKMIELTLQMTETNNENLNATVPLLEIYKGKYDDKIRNLAREIKKEINTPFFFRLNNEMNTDWTSYSGIITLSDPEIYVEGWRRVYEIFEEEGVDNAIWVFNPNDRNFPPCNWNNFTAYYPGDEYVHMIGITGYNTGTYFIDVTGETWRSFTEIYDEIEKSYRPFFSEFPWIITEFSSSSVGGDKVKWIEDVFKNIHKYKNIKAAVWFSAPDMDMRPGFEGKISRPYMLDETEETLDAFRRGIKKTTPPQAEVK